MTTSRLSSGLNRFFEHTALTTDLARALRSSIAFVTAWVLCLAAGHPEAAPFAATAAHNVGLADFRGDYHARQTILLTMTLVMALYAFAGILVGGNSLSATLMMGAIGLYGGI